MSRRTEPSGAFSNAALCAAPAGSTTGVSSTADAECPECPACPAVLEAARGSAAAAASLESASLRGVHATLPQVSIQVQVRLPAALQRCLLQ